MARNSNSKRSNNRSRITNVRITDPTAGEDQLRIDRQMSAVKTSESQTRIVIGDIIDIGTNAADTFGVYGFDSIFGSDDFISMIQQYNLFRVKSIKFDIYDINTRVGLVNQWGVWHDNYELTAPPYTRANIADLPDSRVLSTGTGQTTLYWSAHGTAENQFQAANSQGSPSQKFGGLRYYIQGTTEPFSQKYSIQVHAVVDFRGRR